jgi:hypothetical protein
MHGFLELFVTAKPHHTTIPLMLSKLSDEALSKSSFPESTTTMVLPGTEIFNRVLPASCQKPRL